MPFTLRGYPDSLNDLTVNNDFACLPKLLKFPVKDGQRIDVLADDQVFKEAVLAKVKEVNQDIRSVKSKFMAIGWYFMMKYFIFLLRVPMTTRPWTVANTYTSVVSIVPGKKTPYVFDIANKGGHGVKVHSLVYFVPGSGRIANGVSVVTHGDTMGVGVMADTSYWGEDGQE
jgi:hypothetical protein